jgi:uncharacterized protein involved in exopolysaccharide biosynthesis
VFDAGDCPGAGQVCENEVSVRHEPKIEPMMPVGQQSGLELSFDEVTALLRQHIKLIILSVAACLAAAAGYLLVTTPQYTATALLLIDARSNILPTQQIRATDANAESAHVETQVEVLRSERITRAVIVSEELTKYREFGAPRPSIMSRFGSYVSSKVPPAIAPAQSNASQAGNASQVGTAGSKATAEDNVPASAVKEFQTRLSVKRNSSTHIIEISFRHSNPKLAAKIANAVASGYLTEQLRQRDDIIRSTSQWLRQRAVDLLGEAHAAETALLKFRGSNTSSDATNRIVLRDLETTAQTYRWFSENFQKRFLETSQSGTFNLADARVVSEAWPPIDKSHPKSLLTLAIAGAAGLSIGFLFALALGRRDRKAA